MIKISVCIGSACHKNGAHNILSTFQHIIEEEALHDKIEVSKVFCMKDCTEIGVAVKVNDNFYRISAKDSRRFFKENVLPLL